MQRQLLPLAALALLAACDSDPNPTVPPTPQPTDPEAPAGGTRVIDQGLDDDGRTRFWHTAQGSYVAPYDWFMAVRDEGGVLLTDRLEEFGYIQSWRHDSLNPDKLPIGFSIERPTEVHREVFGLDRDWVGITCSACHVGAIDHGGSRTIIEGAPALADMQKLNEALAGDLRETLEDPTRFGAFAAALDPERTDESDELLRTEVTAYLAHLDQYVATSFHERDNPEVSLAPGPGRVDAFGVILNRVSSVGLGIEENSQSPNAPVSYPFVWDSPNLAWVQYNGLAQNPFTRNIGEVLGVYGRIQLDPRNQETYLASTVRFEELQELEQLLREIKAPRWSQVFGDEPNDALAARGEQIYMERCDSCHSMQPATVTNENGAKYEEVKLFDLKEIGTDGQFIQNLIARSQVDMGHFGDSSPLALSRTVIPNLPFVSDELKVRVLTALAKVEPLQERDSAARLLGMVTISLAMKYLGDADVPFGSPRFMEITNRAGNARPPNPLGYKARSLRGIFATGPYLHNGSVRTLEDLLRPAAEREETFRVGTYEYDVGGVGYANAGPFVFDTTLKGNSNAGHEFGTDLTDEERKALLEYLKTL